MRGWIYSFLFLISFGIQAENLSKARVRIFLSDSKLAGAILSPKFDIASEDITNQNIDVIGSPDLVDRLRTEGLNAKVMETNSSILDPRYRDPVRIDLYLERLKASYPELVTLENLGNSTWGRPIYAVRVTAPNKVATKPSVLFTALHQGREVMSTEVALDILSYLLNTSNNIQDPRVAEWLSGLNIWVVPQLNPDSLLLARKDHFWKKNAAHTTKGIYGVDIEHNFPFIWSQCNGSVKTPALANYRGPAAESEPETKALMRIAREENVVLSIQYRAYGELVLAPYGCTKLSNPEELIFADIGGELSKRLMKDAGGGSYDFRFANKLNFSNDGDSLSWLYSELNIMSFGVYLNAADQGFQPDYDKWRDRTVVAQRAGWQYALDRVLKGPQIRGIVRDAQTNQLLSASVRNAVLPYRREHPRSSKNGVYEKLLIPGKYEMVYSAKGYANQHIFVDVDAKNPTKQDVYLDRSTAVTP